MDERDRQWKNSFKEEVKTVQEIHQEFEIELQRKKLVDSENKKTPSQVVPEDDSSR